MTKEDKQLLLTDLCARLPYEVKGLHRGQVHKLFTIDSREINSACIQVDGYDAWFSVDTFKPYLRPMSSMTKEELFIIEGNFAHLKDGNWLYESVDEITTLLNSHHLDYRGLIEKGLALEAPENIYK